MKSRLIPLAAAGAAILASSLVLAAKPGGGTTTTWTVRLQAVGDSITRGYNATCTGNTNFLLDAFCFSGGDQPENSFFDGTSTAVVSLADKFTAAGASTTYSKAAAMSGSEMVGGTNNFATQAAAVVSASRKPVQVKVLLGGNDICNRSSTAAMYSEATWTQAVQAGLNTLTQRLPDGSTVVLIGVPRVQELRQAGLNKTNANPSRVNCPNFWETYDVCEIATVDKVMGGETLAQRMPTIIERQQAYNTILKQQAALYNAQASTTRVEVIAETDGDTSVRPEVGNYTFDHTEINGGDCFHPSVKGQNTVSTVVWGNDPYTKRP